MKRIAYVAAGTAVLLLASFEIAAGQDRASPPTQPQGGMMGPGGAMPMMGAGHMGMVGMADQVERRIVG
jgi:hypothetical protein